TRASQLLLADLPAFLEEMDQALAALRDPQANQEAHLALADIDSACRVFASWLGSSAPDPEQLADIQASLLAACQRLALPMGAQLEHDLSVGATPYPPANIVLLSARRLLAGTVPASLVGEAVELCRGQLAGLAGDPAL